MTTAALDFPSRMSFGESLHALGAQDWSGTTIRRHMATECTNWFLRPFYRLFGVWARSAAFTSLLAICLVSYSGFAGIYSFFPDPLIGAVLLVFWFIGSAAAGPLYGAFPVAAVFMRKGVKFTNLLVFLGAWSTTKIPMFLFELSALGAGFALTRLLVNIPGIIGMAYILRLSLREEEVNDLYARAAAEER